MGQCNLCVSVQVNRMKGFLVDSLGYCVSTHAYICMFVWWGCVRGHSSAHRPADTSTLMCIWVLITLQDEGEMQKNLKSEPTNSFSWMQIWHPTLFYSAASIPPSSLHPSFRGVSAVSQPDRKLPHPGTEGMGDQHKDKSVFKRGGRVKPSWDQHSRGGCFHPGGQFVHMWKSECCCE